MKNNLKSILPDKITVLSANCQGLRGYEKRADVLNYLRDTGASVVCLQDTRLLEIDKQFGLNALLVVQKQTPEVYLIILNTKF